MGPNGYWLVSHWTRPGSAYVESVRELKRSRGWGPEQAAGGPDTPQSGDIVTAWASASQDGQPEWLVLDYADPVIPASIHVYETHNTGALVKVSVFTAGDKEVVVWEGQDPTPVGAGIGVSRIPANVNFETKRVKLHIDSPAVPGWNEIDAVGLVDERGNTQWAIVVQASSTYASRSHRGARPGGTTPRELIPHWCAFGAPSAAYRSGSTTRERRAAAAFGWPFLALHASHDVAWTATASGGPRYASSGGAPTVTGTATPTFIPYRPILVGFALNTGLYALALALILYVLFRPMRALKELLRLRRGHCLVCDYDLRYDFVRGCPECGWRRDGAE